jgi:hypothetical protein
MLTQTTLRPGLLVALSTRIRGNVKYQKTMIEEAHVTDDGRELAEWNTQREIADAQEHELSEKVRAKASSMIRACCAKSSNFGLLCPRSSVANLEAATVEARKLAAEFNATARFSRIDIFVVTGVIADNDVEAIRAVSSDLQSSLMAMEAGLRNLDVKVVREAAMKAKDVGRMLSPALQEKVKIAIEAARATAKKIVKAGTEAAIEIDTLAIAKIQEQRMAFLDLDPVVEASEPMITEPSRAIDLDPDVKAASDDYVERARAIEI